MSATQRLARRGATALTAIVLSLAWVVPALAEVDDGDGFDGDELLVLPLALLAAGAVVAWTLLRRRRGTPRSDS